MSGPRVLFVENGDSFSFNVLEALPIARREAAVVSATEAVEALERATPTWAVLGPGPFDPRAAGLLPVVAALAEQRVPTLGICLGHQAIGVHFGATLAAVEPHHGVRDDVRFERSRLLPHFFGHARVMRYHSLALVDPLPPCLRAIARTADGTVMALEHTTLPMLGLQFHPDSFATSSGEAMIRDFVRAALRTGDEAQP